jgi:hypothetical protein
MHGFKQTDSNLDQCFVDLHRLEEALYTTMSTRARGTSSPEQ